MVCERAGITHGALYHHFVSKTALFRAVVASSLDRLMTEVREAATSREGWAQIEAATRAYLTACAEPAVQALVFRDGPRVLIDDIDQIDAEASEPVVLALLEEWMAAGLLRPLPMRLVARVVGAAFAEAGGRIAEADDPTHAHAQVEALLLQWIGALRRSSNDDGLAFATDRLTIRPWAFDDGPAIASLLAPDLSSLADASGSELPEPARWVADATRQSTLRFSEGSVGLWTASLKERLVAVAGLLPQGQAMRLVVVVESTSRRRRVGAELAAAALREARIRGVSAIEADALATDAAWTAFLEHVGFVCVDHHPLPDGQRLSFRLPTPRRRRA